MKLEDVVIEGTDDISLSKLSGKKVKDIVVAIGNPFGEPLVEIRQVLFEDGTSVWVGGEHDCAYLESEIVSDEDMNSLYEQQYGND